MGCDGGTIPRRDELVRLKKKPEQKDKDSEMQYRWRHCALTQQKLQEPIVMCGIGRLYAKQNVLECLLEKDKMPESCSHIKSLKDIKDLNLTPNPAYKTNDNSFDVRSAPYICSLIGLEMSGQFRFVALWSCGCVFSERALKEIKGNVCNSCQTPYTEQDVIILNGTDEDVDLMRVKMDSRVARRKSEKKSKKPKASATVTSAASTSTAGEMKPPTLIPKMTNSPASAESKISPTFVSKVTIPPAPAVTPPAVPVVNASKTLKRKDKHEKYEDPAFKKSKDAYSVAKDPKATDVYKSLFTSHEDEQNQSRAHWVTYNPFYN